MPGISAVSPPISAQPAWLQPSAIEAITRSAMPELELGADAVIGRDQQRIAIARRLEVEEAAEPAQSRVRPRPRRRFGERRDRPDQRIAGGDRDAGLGIGIGFVLAHETALARTRLDFHGQLAKRRA
jgi:hypothetical protein